jgi:hypothetical protein
VAVKVTPVPEHIVVAEDVIDTLDSEVPVTVNVIPVDVAEVFDKQTGKVPPVTRTAFITSPLDGT